MMLAPGSRASMALATSAVTIDPLTSCRLLVDQEHAVGVAVEREADVRARTRRTAARRSRWFSGSIGSAGWFGNVPSSSGKRWCSVDREPFQHRRRDESAHAVRGVDRPP